MTATEPTPLTEYRCANRSCAAADQVVTVHAAASAVCGQCGHAMQAVYTIEQRKDN